MLKSIRGNSYAGIEIGFVGCCGHLPADKVIPVSVVLSAS